MENSSKRSKHSKKLYFKTQYKKWVDQLNSFKGVYDRDELGNTKLHVLVQHELGGNQIEKLIAEGANPNAKNKAGLTPLHSAANAEVARILIEAGAECSFSIEPECEPLTPFQQAVRAHNDYLIVTMLESVAPQTLNPTLPQVFRAKDQHSKWQSNLYKVAFAAAGGFFYTFTGERLKLKLSYAPLYSQPLALDASIQRALRKQLDTLHSEKLTIQQLLLIHCLRKDKCLIGSIPKDVVKAHIFPHLCPLLHTLSQKIVHH